MRMDFELALGAGSGSGEIYLEVASVVVVLILLGRYFEARAKRRAGAALEALLELGAKDVAVLGADGEERRVPVEELRVGDLFVVRPGEKIATDGVDRVGQLLRRHVAPDRREHSRRGRTRRRGDRRDRQRLRPARRPRDAGRRRHGGRADRPARDAGAGGQGPGAAARRPGLGRLRPDRDRDRARDARLLARRGLRSGVRLRRRRRGPDHRVPVRARPRDADGAARRLRPGRAARHPDQGARDARADAPRDDDRPRQDRHRHRGAADGSSASRR